MSLTMPNALNELLCLYDVQQGVAFQKIDHSQTTVYRFLQHHRSGNDTVFKQDASPDHVVLKYYLYDLYAFELIKARGRFWGNFTSKWQAFLQQYNSFLTIEGFRSIHYLLVICLRESRHARFDGDYMDCAAKYCNIGGKKEDKNLESKLNDLFTELKDAGFYSMDAHRVTSYITNKFPRTYTIDVVLHYLHLCFKLARWESSYGGDAWDEIATAASDVLRGNKSMFQGMDHAFTLSHNNGAIYNKPFLYKLYNDHMFAFSFILDCQRSGQLVNAINSGWLQYAVHEIPHPTAAEIDKIAVIDKGYLFQGTNYTLVELCRAIAELNPNHYKPFSFLKLREDGCQGVYTSQLDLEQKVLADKKINEPFVKDYYGGELPQGLSMAESMLVFDDMEDIPYEGVFKHSGIGVDLDKKATLGLSSELPVSKHLPILKREQA